MIEFPSIQPMQSTTLEPPSLVYAADLAARISDTLRSLATGLHSGAVGLGDAVDEMGWVLADVSDLCIGLDALHVDGRAQLATIGGAG